MSNICLHPRHCRRFYSAVDNVVQGIRGANLESELSRLGENEWNQTIVDAVVTELRAPSTGLTAVVKSYAGQLKKIVRIGTYKGEGLIAEKTPKL